MLPYIPTHQGSGRAWIEHERATVSVTTSGRSAMRDVAGAAGASDDLEIPASVEVDVAAAYRIGDHFSAYATATNITGAQRIESWRPYGARPAAPFQAMVGLKANL